MGLPAFFRTSPSVELARTLTVLPSPFPPSLLLLFPIALHAGGRDGAGIGKREDGSLLDLLKLVERWQPDWLEEMGGDELGLGGSLAREC